MELRLLIPPGSSPPETEPEGDKDKEAEDGAKDEALELIQVVKCLRRLSNCRCSQLTMSCDGKGSARRMCEAQLRAS